MNMMKNSQEVMQKIIAYQLLLLIMLVLLPSGVALSQVKSVGVIRISPTNQSGTPAQAFYGYGSEFTDTTDEEEIEIGFLPPQSYYVWLNRPCDGPFAGDPCRWQEDFRGVPDSVEQNEVQQFMLEFSLGLLNNTGADLRLSILNPDWPDIVDSINLVDPVVPTAFNRTFTGPITTTLKDLFTSRLTMRVYYNLATSSASDVQSVAEFEELSLIPNPSHGLETRIKGAMKPGDEIIVLNLLGEIVLSKKIDRVREEVSLRTGDSLKVLMLLC